MTEEQQLANINDIQRLHFELFRRVRYNLLDGERVVRDLLDWHDLWYSVLPTRFPYSFNEPDDMQYHPYTELAMLRHARWDSWPADTLYIGPTMRPSHNYGSALKSVGSQAKSR